MTGLITLRVDARSGGRLSAWPTLARSWAAVLGLRGWRRWGLAVLLGAVAVLALPPLHVLPALVPAFVGLIWLLQGAGSRLAAAGIGFLFGLGYFTAGLYWVANALLTRPEEFGWLAPFAPLGLALILAPFLMLPALAARLAGFGSIGQVVLFAAAWTFAEWLRSWLFTGFPWNLIGTVWSFAPAMLQVSSLAGVYGLSLITVLAAAMPAVLAGPATRRRLAWAAVLSACTLPTLTFALGQLRLESAGEVPAVADVRLRLVQPNIPQDLKWRPDLVDANFMDQLRLGAQETVAPPTHVIWSEVAAPMFLAESPARLALIGAHTPDNGLTLLGTLRRTPKDQPFRLWNSLIAVDRRGEVVGVYDKSHLVPFGEFMPLRELISVSNFTIGFTDFSPGRGTTTLDLPHTPPFSPLICYEVIFPGQVVARGTTRPTWLLNITNDGWYGNSAGPYQHLAAAQLRAVEEGLPVVRVANTGISAIIDPYGRITRSLRFEVQGILDSELPQSLSKPTVYARWGNTPVLVLSGLSIVLVLLSSRRV